MAVELGMMRILLFACLLVGDILSFLVHHKRCHYNFECANFYCHGHGPSVCHGYLCRCIDSHGTVTTTPIPVCQNNTDCASYPCSDSTYPYCHVNPQICGCANTTSTSTTTTTTRDAYTTAKVPVKPCPTCDQNLSCEWNTTCAESETCMIQSYPGYKFTVHCSKIQDCQFIKAALPAGEIYCCNDRECLRNYLVQSCTRSAADYLNRQ
ncbi:fibropellin-1-like isoform X2 [Ostrea edulis]|uniref:fibropellin-1-like isoform X2 n=1 Tax=Ostrea edulis TaxID=37623 RepID=UPI0024AEB1EE|nr:fibropellin-1-like isoform X2 [Ostrea edulis]